MPIESVVSKFPRMIRDLSKKLDKKMELYMSGEDTELDRTVIDEIGDPLMHLLRNSADHGLESAEVRKERGKSEVGLFSLMHIRMVTMLLLKSVMMVMVLILKK